MYQKKGTIKKPKRNLGRGRGRKLQYGLLRTKPRKNPYLSKANRFNNFGKLPVQVKPRTITNKFMTTSRTTKDGIEAIVQVPIIINGNATIAIPAHPLFYGGRMFNITLNSTSFTIKSSCLHFCPIKGTDEGGNLIMAGQPRCTEVTQGATFIDVLTQIGASITPVWAPCEFNMPRDNTKYPVLPLMGSHIPYNYFAGCLFPEGAHALSYYGNLFLSLKIKFEGISNHVNLTSVAAPLTFTLAVGGVSTTANTLGTTKMIVSYSTCTNIDIGEFVIIPTITVFGTPTILNITHNGENINYATAGDQGTITGLSFIET
jgi:hypothetical protein